MKTKMHSAQWCRRKASRLFSRCCTRYGVSAFDWPTLVAIYPLHARTIARLIKTAQQLEG